MSTGYTTVPGYIIDLAAVEEAEQWTVFCFLFSVVCFPLYLLSTQSSLWQRNGEQ